MAYYFGRVSDSVLCTLCHLVIGKPLVLICAVKRAGQKLSERWNSDGPSAEEATAEPGLGCLSSLGSQRTGGHGTGSGDQPGTSCCCPLLPWLHVS